ncbi:hypothetical protein SAMN04490220_1190 [Rhodococcus jostii]|uniref:Uncharacterized protein n=1 Tax=Rhodococcus jostii TaxID=132919 RepID=A0A1H4R310_RHOJO|nr:hypothetical protein SAMN04490220_1190 [Rhodococcus jostii]
MTHQFRLTTTAVRKPRARSRTVGPNPASMKPPEGVRCRCSRCRRGRSWWRPTCPSRAVRRAAQLAGQHGARVTALHVLTDGGGLDSHRVRIHTPAVSWPSAITTTVHPQQISYHSLWAHLSDTDRTVLLKLTADGTVSTAITRLLTHNAGERFFIGDPAGDPRLPTSFRIILHTMTKAAPDRAGRGRSARSHRAARDPPTPPGTRQGIRQLLFQPQSAGAGQCRVADPRGLPRATPQKVS